jgi:hypothetical protein
MELVCFVFYAVIGKIKNTSICPQTAQLFEPKHDFKITFFKKYSICWALLVAHYVLYCKECSEVSQL